MAELIFHVVIAIASLYIIMKSASYAILAISDYAKQTGLSEYLIGFLVVAIGTSLPELSAAIFAALLGKGSLVLGDVIGANVLNLTIILGVGALIGKKILLKAEGVKKNVVMIIAVSLLPIILGADGTFTRSDGLVLILAFLIYIIIIIKQEREIGKVKKSVPLTDLIPDMFVFIGALVALLLSARWLINSVVQIGDALNIPLFIMGLFFIAIGTTVPELTIQIKSVLRGIHNIGIGNVLGSVVINASLIIGIASLIRPITVEVVRFIVSGIFMIAAVLAVIIIMREKHMTWKHGVILLIFYAIFVIVQVLM